MNDKKYEIKSWNPILINSKSLAPLPSIYILPDDNFFKFIENKDSLSLQGTIFNSNSIYDGHTFDIEIHSSADFPNYRPLFFNATMYYTIVLTTSNWYSYPTDNGYIILSYKEKSPTQQIFIPSYNDIDYIPKTVQSQIKSSFLQPTPPNNIETFQFFNYIKPSFSHIQYILIIILLVILILLSMDR